MKTIFIGKIFNIFVSYTHQNSKPGDIPLVSLICTPCKTHSSLSLSEVCHRMGNVFQEHRLYDPPLYQWLILQLEYYLFNQRRTCKLYNIYSETDYQVVSVCEPVETCNITPKM